jgi:hypothetical protein
MGCNCKKPQVLNNTKSKDHLNLLFKVYEDVLGVKDFQEYTEAEMLRVRNVFISIFPNIKQEPNVELMVQELKELYKQKKK